jgi:uncharacterized protein (TIGR02444 family)
MTPDDAAADSFWRFSLMVYAKPGVSAALLDLQDRGGHNVNLILFGLWLAVCRGRRLDAAGWGRARAAIAEIDREVVLPLRRLRRSLGNDRDEDVRDLRRRVLALELVAERKVQARLAATLRGRSLARADDRAALAQTNLRRILGADSAAPEAAVLRRAVADR